MGGVFLQLAAQQLAPLLYDLGKFGADHLKAKIGHPQQPTQTIEHQITIPNLREELAKIGVVFPSVPSVQKEVGKYWGQVGLPARQTAQEGAIAQPATVATSYAAELESNPRTACKACTMRHIATMHEAAREAASTDDPEVRRAQLALLAAEALVWQHYDANPERLAATNPHDRAAIEPVARDVRAMLSEIPHAPERALLAWAATSEAMRFASSPQPTERDQTEMRRRIADVMGWIGYMESAEREKAGQALDTMRAARHRLAKDGPTPEALEDAEERLRSACIALTPEASPQQAQDIARRMATIRERFFRDALSAVAASRGGKERWYKDRDTLLPAELQHFLARGGDPTAAQLPKAPPSDVPFGGALGATPESVAAFQNLLRFGAAIGVIERERQMPATWEGIVKGAYSPDLNTLLLSPAAMAEDPDGLRTLIHETAHALLHSPRCLTSRTPSRTYEEEYEGTIEEREADLTSLLVLTRAGLPLELDDGRRIPPREWHVDADRLRREVDDLTYRRVTWAAGVILEAMRIGPDAAPDAYTCPVRTPVP